MNTFSTNLIVRAAKSSELHELREGVVISADLGFGKAKSTGLAVRIPGKEFEPVNVTFGAFVSNVMEHLQEHKRITLILEAPLSAAFDDDGNAVPRSIEKGVRVSHPPSWYLRAGAVTSLAALSLLRNLRSEFANGHDEAEVILVESFYTRKFDNNDSDIAKLIEEPPTSLSHKQVAELALTQFLDNEGCELYELKPGEGEVMVAYTDFIGNVGAQCSPPPIIIIERL